MFKHLLIATEGSDLAQRAVDQGLKLAKALDAEVTVVMVTEPWTSIIYGDVPVAYPIDQYEADAAANATRVLTTVATLADQQQVACRTRHMPDQTASEGILQVATELGCDLIVMASHGRRGLSRLLLGSQTQKVVTFSPVPVLVCR